MASQNNDDEVSDSDSKPSFDDRQNSLDELHDEVLRIAPFFLRTNSHFTYLKYLGCLERVINSLS